MVELQLSHFVKMSIDFSFQNGSINTVSITLIIVAFVIEQSERPLENQNERIFFCSYLKKHVVNQNPARKAFPNQIMRICVGNICEGKVVSGIIKIGETIQEMQFQQIMPLNGGTRIDND